MITTPFRRFDAPSRLSAAYRPFGATFTSFTVRASTWMESVLKMLVGSVTSQK